MFLICSHRDTEYEFNNFSKLNLNTARTAENQAKKWILNDWQYKIRSARNSKSRQDAVPDFINYWTICNSKS